MKTRVKNFGIRNLESLESGIQLSESGIHGVESGIRDSLGFLYMGRTAFSPYSFFRFRCHRCRSGSGSSPYFPNTRCQTFFPVDCAVQQGPPSIEPFDAVCLGSRISRLFVVSSGCVSFRSFVRKVEQINLG